MKKSVRVAVLIDSFDVSGPGRQLVAIVPHLSRHGFDIRVILFRRRGEPRAPFEEFVESAGIAYEVVTDAMRFDLRLIDRVDRVLRRWNPDIVETHNYRCGAVVFCLRKLGASWRWVGFFHGLTAEDRKVRLYHWLDRRVLRHADRIVVMSRAQRLLFEVADDRVVQISNAVLPGAVTQAGESDLTRLVSGLERPCFAVVARLSHEKGVDVFLQAVRLLRERGLPLSAVIAGDGPERANLQKLAASLGLDSTVHFLGVISPIEGLYPCVDVVVLPSRSEGLPNVLLEALRAHRRIVATSVGAVPEVVADPLAAELVEPGYPEPLAEAMQKASAGPLSAEALVAQQAVLERFSLDRRLKDHLTLYRALLGERDCG